MFDLVAEFKRDCEAQAKVQAAAAIKWIDELLVTDAKQAAGSLGDKSGYCCLGLGCVTLDIPFVRDHGTSKALKDQVGLLSLQGFSKTYDSRLPKSLVFANDQLAWSFRQAGELLKNFPDQYFIYNVAQIIKEHYDA